MRIGVMSLRVRYGGHKAIDGVSFEVAQGQISAVVGGDGAGKTSLLRALAGALTPAGGHVEAPPSERIGYVAPGPGIYRDLTVGENIRFAAAAYGVEGDVLRQRMAELLELTDLAPARDRLGGALSGGMRQKLALACALIHRPELVILDEPTTGVDPVSRLELWRLLTQTAAAGAAVVLSTAYLDEAERAANILVLTEGAELASGSFDDIVAAVPGQVVVSATPVSSPNAWRRGETWRVWCPPGEPIGAHEAIRPDLEDALVAMSLARIASERTEEPVR